MPILRVKKTEGGEGATLPIDIEIEGQVGAYPTIGQPIIMFPPIRAKVKSGTERWDYFYTTPVEDIIGKEVLTENSTWKITYYNE